jgi:hypothetical protein
MRLLILFISSCVTFLISITSFATPAVPEPGIIIYGRVYSTSNNAPIIFTMIALKLTDKLGDTVVLNGDTNPPVRIMTVNAVTYYVARVPFYTRVVGNPGTQANFDLPNNSFELKQQSTAYTLDNVVVDGKSAAVINSELSRFNMAAGQRGQFLEINLRVGP